MKDLSRNVRLICRVCGNDMFETLDNTEDMLTAPDNTKLKCSDCKKVYTKRELLDDNEEVINSNIEDIRRDAVEEIKRELNKSLKRIKIK